MKTAIFVTDVVKKKDSNFLRRELLKIFPATKINFDLEDCDKILRIENLSQVSASDDVISCLYTNGFRCTILNE